MSSLQIVTNIFILPCVTLTIVKKAFRVVKHYALTEFALRIISLTFIVKNWKNVKKYYPAFKNIRIILEETHTLLTPNEQHRKVFTDIPGIYFKNGKILKDHLVRSVLPKIDVAGNSGPCGGKRPPCELCKLMKKTSTFKKRNSDEIYHIHKPLNCNSKNTVYLIESNQCWKQCTGGSKTKFRYRANNYKSTHRKFKNEKQVSKEALKQKIFHEHFCSDNHNGIQDWVILWSNKLMTKNFLGKGNFFGYIN